MKNFWKKNRSFMLHALILTVIFAVPFFFDGLRFGSDTAFHINRIESLYTAIRNRNFYPRVFLDQNYEYSYGSPLFYSVFFLYIPVLFRFLGISPVVSYKLFLLLCVFCSAWSVQVLISRFTSKRLPLFFGAALYLFNNLTFSDAFYRGALGEIMAFVFIPVLLLSFYEIFYEEGRRGYIRLILGFSALLQCHNLSFLLMCFLFVLVILFHIRSLTLKRILGILLCTGTAILLNAFFLFPMLEQLSLNIYRINTYFANTISGVSLKEMFDFHMDGPFALTCGPVMILMPVLYLFVKKERYITCSFLLSILCLVFSSNLIPWAKIPAASVLQWPGRFMIPMLACVSLTAAYAVSRLDKKQVTCALLGVLLIQTVYMDFCIISIGGPIRNDASPEQLKDVLYYQGEGAKDAAWYNMNEVSSPEYLIRDAGINYRENPRLILNKTTGNYPDIAGIWYNYIAFTPTEYGEYRIPYCYYRGYVAQVYIDWDYDRTIVTYPDLETGLTDFVLPEDIDLNREVVVSISYMSTGIQKASSLISAGSIILFLGYLIYTRKKA